MEQTKLYSGRLVSEDGVDQKLSLLLVFTRAGKHGAIGGQGKVRVAPDWRFLSTSRKSHFRFESAEGAFDLMLKSYEETRGMASAEFLTSGPVPGIAA